MSLKNSFWIIIFNLLAVNLFSQIYNPVKWKFDVEHDSKDEITIIYSAKIDKGWNVYSQYLASDDGPIATTIEYTSGNHYTLIGKSIESGNRKEGYDEIFEMDVVKFSDTYIIKQKIKVVDPNKAIEGYLTFQSCDHEKCLPPMDFDFSFVPARYMKKETGETAPPAGGMSAGTMDTSVENVASGAEKTSIQLSTLKAVENKKENPGLLAPLTWSATVEPIGENVFRITAEAVIEQGWHVYSSSITNEDGPIPTKIYFDESDHITVNNDLKESGSKIDKGFDPFFEMDLVKLKNDISLSQTFTVSDFSKDIKGYVEYQTCDATRCLPPVEVYFIFNASENRFYIGDSPDGESPGVSGAGISSVDEKLYGITQIDLDRIAEDCNELSSSVTDANNQGMMTIFFLGFIGGLLALLTPCVFPMIPLTVSFFTKSSGNKKKGITNASLYGFFILFTYLLLSVPFHLLDSVNPDILNDISTNVWLNLAFFAIFIFFAFSFFGYYELTLPAGLTNKVSSAEGVGGIVGIFFMALTLALVSFSCTGPILGTLLAGALSSDGGAWQLTSGMAGFGLALALPFALFAAFPGWMNNLPRSGGWLNTVKVVLGFIELALAFKFLSNADLVKHWGLLKIEPFLIIWIIIAVLLAAYLFGLIRFPHDSPLKKVGFVRGSLGVISMAFAIYLMTGFRYNEDTKSFHSLSLLSGLAPPVGYSWMYPADCPQNLECFHDFETGMAYAKRHNKPVFLDFTGYACVNCRKMEEHVWPEQSVISKLKNDYVVISLYVDDKKELPQDQQVEVTQITGTKRKLRNYGHKWAHFQATYFNNNSQPFYVLLTPEAELLNTPVGYTPDAKEFADFLQCGLTNFSGNGVIGKVDTKE